MEEQRYSGGIIKSFTPTATGQAEDTGLSIVNLPNKMLIRNILIETLSTSWGLFLYTEDDYSTGEKQVVFERDGDMMVDLNLFWEDADESGELHYKVVSASGSETHDITPNIEARR